MEEVVQPLGSCTCLVMCMHLLLSPECISTDDTFYMHLHLSDPLRSQEKAV